jgi:O-antigen/teichoic acid export membrane protein
VSDQSRRRFAFVRLLSSAVGSQALLSAANLIVGLILIRGASDAQYGFYVLGASALLLLASLQSAFCNPPLAIRIGLLDGAGRAALVGGLHHAQRRLLTIAGGVALVAVVGLWTAGVVDGRTGPLLLAVIAAALAVLYREYFRVVLFAYRRPQDVLRIDLVHVLLLVAGVLVAVSTPAPAAAAMLAIGVAAAASGLLLAHALRRHELWSAAGPPGLLRDVAPLAAWSTAGAATHWIFSQGYVYLVAGTLDVTAVAAIAATRLLLMPVNLLSTGIASQMLPLASGWLVRHGPRLLWRRLCLIALAVAVATLCYFVVVWLARDWLFAEVLKKQLAQRDELLLLWGVIFLVMVVRDQLIYQLAAQGRFRVLMLLTLASAAVSLLASYAGMLQFGMTGALLGILAGELISAGGIVILATRRSPLPLAAAGSA